MTKPPVYLLDSDIFITAKNTYYAFDICPGFWGSLLHYHEKKRVFSIDRVRSELLAGRKTEDLVKWVRGEVPDSFFLPVEDGKVPGNYEQIMLWVQRHPRYYDEAKAKFAAGADGWLVAYAKVHGYTVATNEKPEPDSRKAIKIPEVCEHFGVLYANTFDLLRALSVQFHFRGPRP
jgi:hypothetical protein